MSDSLKCWNVETVLRPVATFFGAKFVDIKELNPESVACCGIYCDHFSEGEPGARFLARQLRYCSSDPWFKKSIGFNSEGLVDVGDLNVYPLEPNKLGKSLQEQVTRLVQTGSKLLLANADFSLTPAVISGIIDAKIATKLAVIRISQRKDVDVVEENKELIEKRSQAGSRLEQLMSDDYDSVIWVQKPEDITDKHYEMLADRACFLSVDADILGPEHGATSAYGGHKSQRIIEVIELIQSLNKLPFVAAEFTGHRPGFELRDRAVTTYSLSIFSALAELLKQGERN